MKYIMTFFVICCIYSTSYCKNELTGLEKEYTDLLKNNILANISLKVDIDTCNEMLIYHLQRQTIDAIKYNLRKKENRNINEITFCSDGKIIVAREVVAQLFITKNKKLCIKSHTIFPISKLNLLAKHILKLSKVESTKKKTMARELCGNI